MPVTHVHTRRGSALVISIVLMMGVVAMLLLSSQRFLGAKTIQQSNFARLQAAYAAEAVAALIEQKVKEICANPQKLITTPLANYYGMGCSDTSVGGVSSTSGFWFGNCLVRWRIEPVEIFDTTFGDTNRDGKITAADASGTYVDNYVYDPNSQPPNYATKNNAANAANPGYSHYRIVTEAYAMNDLIGAGATAATAAPWGNPGQSSMMAQAQRYIQIEFVNLFRYVIFYAAPGHTGDIEFHPGSSVTISGAVHTNGGLYLGGHATAYTSGNYHDSASMGSGVVLTFGGANNIVNITGVDGIFRQRKVVNYTYAKNNGQSGYKDGYNVPLSGVSGMSGNNDLNGDTSTSAQVLLDGVPLTCVNDSRNGLAGLNAYVRDNRKGAGLVSTLANLPQLAGYPFEPQQSVGQGTYLYFKKTGDSHYTILSSPPAVQVYYKNYYGRDFTPVELANVTPGVIPVPVYAADMPLYSFLDSSGLAYADVWPTQPALAAGVNYTNSSTDFTAATSLYPRIGSATLASGVPWNTIPYNATAITDAQRVTFLPDTEAPTTNTSTVQGRGPESRGYYLDGELSGTLNTASGLIETGLVIRERGRRNTQWKWNRDATASLFNQDPPIAAPVSPAALLAASPGLLTVSTGEWLRAYSAYLCSNYAVYFGVQGGNSIDITPLFFSYYGPGIAVDPKLLWTDLSGFTATEDLFTNWRDADWLRLNGYVSSTDAQAFKNNVVTLNIANVQNFIQNTPYSTIDATAGVSAATMCSSRFDGVVYIHRTPRLNQALALGTPAPAALATDNTGSFDPLMPLLNSPLMFPRQPLNASDVGNTATYLPPRAYFQSPTIGTAMYPVTGSANDGTVSTASAGVATWTRNGDSSQAAWSMYPFPKQVRIAKGTTIGWGGLQPSGRARGLTVITPNHCYVWGNWNTTKDTAGKLPPCAVFSDGLTALSSAYVDSASGWGKSPNASSTVYNASFVINNMPTDLENQPYEGSGGTHNVVRYVENWGNQTYTFMGSLVVLNRMRYSRGYVSASGYYGVPVRVFTFNSDLLTAEGRPPASPGGQEVHRLVSSVNLINK